MFGIQVIAQLLSGAIRFAEAFRGSATRKWRFLLLVEGAVTCWAAISLVPSELANSVVIATARLVGGH